MPLCFPQLTRECLGCGKVFGKWSSKIQHVCSSANEECSSSGANNIEKKLSNEHYSLCQEIARIRKKSGRFHSVIEQMMDMTQNENITDSSNVPLSLKVSMPPPDYFNNVNWAEYSVDEVEYAD